MMNKLLIFSAIMIFGITSAQTEQNTIPTKPIDTKPQKDTISTNEKIQKESDLKTMDAVKTQDHKKVTPKPKTTAKDSVKTKKNTRS
jgi:hypothetical protein